MEVLIKKINNDAIIPSKGSNMAAGLDIYSNETVFINPGKTVMIGTGIAVEIPEGFFGGIYARSGLSIKQGLRPANCVGVIDSDYRGEVIVALHNDSDQLRCIEKGDRIAQLIIQAYRYVEFKEVEELEDTERGAGGFGHTGK